MICKFLESTKDKKINVSKDTQFVILVSRTSSLDLIFDKENIRAQVLVFSLAKSNINFKINVSHLVKNTECLVEVRGVVTTKSHLNVSGSIFINTNAGETKSFLRGKILLLGDSSSGEFIPVLDIKNNTVSASHGVSIGRIDAYKLYYLSSRGLTSDDVSGILAEAHFMALQQQIIESKISKKLVDKLL